MSSTLLPLFHTLPTPSRKIPAHLPSPQLFLPSPSEGMSFFLALVTHSYPCLYFSRVSTNCQFCFMSLLCQRLLRALRQAPSLLRMKQSNLAAAVLVQEPQIDRVITFIPTRMKSKHSKHSCLVQTSAVILLTLKVLAIADHILKC